MVKLFLLFLSFFGWKPPGAGSVKAVAATSSPLCQRGADPDLWLANTLELIATQIQMVVTAVRTGVRLKAWRAVENIMARDVEHALRGCKPVVIYAGGPEARREVHVRDSVRSAEHPDGRVIVARVYEHGRGGTLQIYTYLQVILALEGTQAEPKQADTEKTEEPFSDAITKLTTEAKQLIDNLG